MLEINKFNKIIVANWKLNGSFEFIESYFNVLETVNFKKDMQRKLIDLNNSIPYNFKPIQLAVF